MRVKEYRTEPCPICNHTGWCGQREELLALSEVARRLPKIDGKKICTSTIFRWCTRGLRGVRLQYVRVGRKICTSHQALLQFFEALAEIDKQQAPRGRPALLGRRPITSKQRLRALQEADEILAKAGI